MSDKLPDVRDLRAHRLLDDGLSVFAPNASLWEATEAFVAMGELPPSLVALRMAAGKVAPTTDRQRYLMRCVIAAVREHERQLRIARTVLAGMQADFRRQEQKGNR